MTKWSDLVKPELIGKSVDVLDQGFIQLVDLMPHPSTGVAPDLAIVNAARVSFLGDSKGYEKDKKLIDYLVKNHHTTPLEMVEFKFRVKAPVVTWWQWARHRTWNFNAQSGRYTPFDEDGFHVPDPNAWRKQSKNDKQGSSESIFNAEDTLVVLESLSDLTFNIMNANYSENISDLSDLLTQYTHIGYTIYQALLDEGAAKEQARLFLPGWGSYYTWIAKVDLHNLLHFLKLRMNSHAQYEIRVYAEAIYEHFVKPIAPVTAAAFEKYVLED